MLKPLGDIYNFSSSDRVTPLGGPGPDHPGRVHDVHQAPPGGLHGPGPPRPQSQHEAPPRGPHWGRAGGLAPRERSGALQTGRAAVWSSPPERPGHQTY